METPTMTEDTTLGTIPYAAGHNLYAIRQRFGAGEMQDLYGIQRAR